MKWLLIQPPIEDFYRTRFREYPLGLLYVAAELEAAGNEVVILDARQVRRPKKIEPPAELAYLKKYYTRENDLFGAYQHFGISYENIAAVVREAKPDVVGISSLFTPYVDQVIETAKVVRAASPGAKIVVGGHHPTADPESLQATGLFDEVVVGEKVPGTFLRKGTWYPSRHLINPEDYKLGRRRYAMILTSRGCPYQCSFCSIHKMSGSAHLTYPVEHVLEEIDICVKKFGVSAIDFQDDNLLFDKDRFKTILENIIRKYSGDDLEFMASNGLNVKDIDEEMLSLMSRVGFKKLDLSLGTANVSARKQLRRPETIEQYEKIAALAGEHDLKTTTYIILGLPTQPLEEMRATIEYLKTKNTLISPSIFYNVPGMPIFEEMKKYEYQQIHVARRSSAFNSFGDDFGRDDIFKLFREIRMYNLGT